MAVDLALSRGEDQRLGALDGPRASGRLAKRKKAAPGGERDLRGERSGCCYCAAACSDAPSFACLASRRAMTELTVLCLILPASAISWSLMIWIGRSASLRASLASAGFLSPRIEPSLVA